MGLQSAWNFYREHFRTTLQLAWPIIVGQVGQVSMGVVDTAMVGQVSKEQVAATGVATAVFFVLSIFGFGLSTAVSPLASIAKSKDDKAETAGILRGSLQAAMLISVIILGTLWVASMNFGILKQEPQVEEMAVGFLRILSWSVIPMVVFLCAKQFSDGLSYTRSSMVITLLGVPLNAFLNWLLIYGNWGFPRLELDGAAYGTLITRTAMMVAMLWYVFAAKELKEYVMQRPKQVWAYTKKVMRTGIPSGFQYFFEIAAFASAMIMAGWIGVSEQAAHQIAINISSVTYMAATGIAAAGSIRVGAAFGRASKEEVRTAGRSALYMGALWMGFCGVFLILTRHYLAAMYIDNAEVEYWATQLLIISALFQLSDGLQVIGLGILRGITDVKVPTIITFFAYWGIGLPIAYILGFHTSLGIEGIWVGLLIGLSTSAVLLLWRFHRLSR